MVKEFEGGYDITKAKRVVSEYPTHLDNPSPSRDYPFDPQGVIISQKQELLEGVPYHLPIRKTDPLEVL